MRQHIIPKSVLKNFTDDKGHLYCFDRDRDVIYSTTPNRAFRQKDMYTFKTKDGESVYQGEERLSRLEGGFQQAITKILDNTRLGNLPQFNSEEIDTIRLFLMVQLRRSRTMRKRMQPEGDKLFYNSLGKGIRKIKDVNRGHVVGKEFEVLLDLVNRKEDLCQYALVNAITGPLPNALRTKGICIGLVEDSKRVALAIGENPVIVVREGDISISDPRAEIFMPIASDVVVSLAGTNEHRSLVKIDHMVSDINGWIVNQSDTVATRSDTLTKDLRIRWKRSRRR